MVVVFSSIGSSKPARRQADLPTRTRCKRYRPWTEGLENRWLLSTFSTAGHPRGGVEVASTATSPATSLALNGVRALANIPYVQQGGRVESLDLYLPTGPEPPAGRPVILVLPGGGWRWVRRNDLGAAVAPFTKFGYAVAVADYAYASSQPGTHVYPTNIEDVRQAVRWLKTNAAKYGIDPTRVVAWGESAGGHLANLLGTNPDGPIGGAPDPNAGVSARVQAVVDFYGPTDLAKLYQEDPRDRSYLDTFLGGSPSQYPDRYANASPITHVSPQSPPFLIFQGTADNANPADQSTSFAGRLAQAGVPVSFQLEQGLPHGFGLHPGHGVDYSPLVLSFLNAALHLPPTSLAPKG